jgi:glycosyltransferase involved in cell wall biosynthesis
MKKSILYWSPCLNPVGTVKSTINSAIAVSRYSKDKFTVQLINACGEWSEYENICKLNNIEMYNFGYNFYKLLPKTGIFASRLSYLIIIIFSAIPLIKLLYKKKPDYIVIHLLTSLPIVLLNIFSFNTKFILRISGHPKLNFLRTILWKFSSNKLFAVTTPTQKLYENLIEKKIFNKQKIFFLPDAIINLSDFRNKNKINNNLHLNPKIKTKFFLSIGRLTKQKNFLYLIDEFYKFSLENKYINLVIIGEGEQKNLLINFIREKKIENRVFIISFTDNVFYYMRKAEAFILPSLWEEVGFVIVEAAFSNLYVISSDCPNGPNEFLLNGQAGSIFSNNQPDKLFLKMKDFCDQNSNEIFLKKIKAKRQAKLYTTFNHHQVLTKIIT